jgi:NAD(P)-dependent dehydrogenase (short-subunit alcohol dehydrogenase family)
VKKIILITGASRGIGAATAKLAAARGYAVCVNYLRNRDAAEAVVNEIVAAGGRAIAAAGDVAVEADVVRVFATVDRELGPRRPFAWRRRKMSPPTAIGRLSCPIPSMP